MKINKEILEYLKITSISITKDNRDYICYLINQDNNIWTFNLANPISFENIEVSIKINIDSHLIQFNAKIINCINESNFVDIELPHIEDIYFMHLYNTLALLEYQDKKYGRRQEKRIEIGFDNSKKFGFKTPEQLIIIENNIQPCAIIDVSIHGICIITQLNISTRNLSNFLISLSFESPDQRVLLQVHKVHEKIISTKNKKFTQISCQILAPINFIWKDRVIKLLEFK